MATWEAAAAAGADGGDGGLHDGGDAGLATAAEGRIVGQSWSS